MLRSAPVTAACLLVAAFAAAGAARSSGDPGLRLELDRQRFELALTDLRGGLAGPRFRVATGSPLHPTPDGVYALHQVVRRPAWRPGSAARAAGARALPPSEAGPMGVAKISFGPDGLALHGGGHPRLLGKPVSLGCVRLADSDMLALLDWLEARAALAAPRPASDRGEQAQPFLRPVRLIVN